MLKAKNYKKLPHQIGRRYGQILGIAVDSTSTRRVLSFVRSRIGYTSQKQGQKDTKKPFLIVTPNPEIVLMASKDKRLRQIINFSDVSLPDGVGLAAASKFLKLPCPKNKIFAFPVLLIQGVWVGLAVIFARRWLETEITIIKGREMFLELIRLANKKRWKVFLLGGGKGVAEKAAKNLARNYKKVKIGFAEGPRLNKEGKPISPKDSLIQREAINHINKLSPQLLFVGFGFPKQEKWIARHLLRLNIEGAMVVGGTLDYIAGKAKLPPKLLDNLGLEWAWRLAREPWRVKRIFNATVSFPLKVFWYKLFTRTSNL